MTLDEEPKEAPWAAEWRAKAVASTQARAQGYAEKKAKAQAGGAEDVKKEEGENWVDDDEAISSSYSSESEIETV